MVGVIDALKLRTFEKFMRRAAGERGGSGTRLPIRIYLSLAPACDGGEGGAGGTARRGLLAD